MGYYTLQNNEAYYKKNSNPFANYGNIQQSNGINTTAVTGLERLLQRLLTGEINFSTSGDNDNEVDNHTQKQIDELTTQINDLLKSQNVKTADELETSISTSEQTQKTYQGNIEKIELGIKLYQSIVENYPSQKSSLEKRIEQETDPTKKQFLQTELTQLESDKKDAEDKINELNTQFKDLQQKLKEEQVKYTELKTTFAQVENYQHEILKLKNKDLPKEVTYDVTKESDDLKNFSSALKEFNSKSEPTLADAAKLAAAFESGDNGVENKTAKKAFEFVKSQHKDLFEKLNHFSNSTTTKD